MEQGGYIEGDEQGTYGYGGGADFNLSMGGGGDAYSIDFGDSDFYYGYGFDTGAEYGDSGYQSGGDLYGAYVDYYTEAGLDLTTAMELAAQDAAAGSVEIATSERGLLPDTLGPETFYGLPYIPDPFLTPYTPIFPDLPPPAPPPVAPLPQSPATQQPGLPPACPGGQYHPYPIGHPQQNICIPFPPAQTSSTPSPPKQTAPAPVPAPKAQQQQKCPTGYYLDPATKQCKPIPQGQPQSCPTGYFRASTGQCLPIPKCTTPGTVFDQARGLCVPKGQAISPLPEGVEGLFGELGKLPWWLWLALGGLLLLSRDGEDGKKTTVTYRRAR
jgi:hypothetical protein